MKEYNLNNRFGKHLVQLTFQQWTYQLKVEVPVGGNCKGLGVLNYALDNFYVHLYDIQGEYPKLIMKDEDGNELEITIEDDNDLKEILVEAKILSFTKE